MLSRRQANRGALVDGPALGDLWPLKGPGLGGLLKMLSLLLAENAELSSAPFFWGFMGAGVALSMASESSLISVVSLTGGR